MYRTSNFHLHLVYCIFLKAVLIFFFRVSYCNYCAILVHFNFCRFNLMVYTEKWQLSQTAHEYFLECKTTFLNLFCIVTYSNWFCVSSPSVLHIHIRLGRFLKGDVIYYLIVRCKPLNIDVTLIKKYSRDLSGLQANVFYKETLSRVRCLFNLLNLLTYILFILFLKNLKLLQIRNF